MVGDDRAPVGQADLFAAIASGHQVDRGGGVMDDVDAWWRAGEKRPVEPLEVLAHQTAGQEVVRLDRLTRRVDRAPVAHPPVASPDGPVEQSNPVARLVRLGFERVQGELPAGVVEEEVVRLGYVIDAGAGSSRLDHVNGDINAGPQLLARGRDHALKSADAPWS